MTTTSTIEEDFEEADLGNGITGYYLLEEDTGYMVLHRLVIDSPSAAALRSVRLRDVGRLHHHSRWYTSTVYQPVEGVSYAAATIDRDATTHYQPSAEAQLMAARTRGHGAPLDP